MKRTTITLLLPVSLLLMAASHQAPSDPASLVAIGKTAFTAKCGVCHGLDRPQGKTKDAAGWVTTVTTMIGKAPANFGAEDKESIVAFLTAKSLFETTCGNPSCHGTDRAADGRSKAAWASTIARMQKHAKGKISDGDAALITGYLALERPAKP
jgi:mono/diheme cytochrome c family protein